MKKNFEIVIGANYGDEGKGLTTDWLASLNKDSAVMRFNGGAQAAHTVQLEDGTRHVFSHFGAGTFAGADTILSAYFVVNPISFLKEAIKLGPQFTKTIVSPDAQVTTPVDMILNQLVEEKRGNDRHGSCGLGFGETIERSERGPKVTVGDLLAEDLFLQKIEDIENTYFEQRANELGVDYQEALSRYNDMINPYIEDAGAFIRHVIVQPDFVTLNDPQYKTIIFEGAQGLRLDQDSLDFPHVTRSNTGLENVARLIRGINANVRVYYVTRTYLTRHGAGPLVGEIIHDDHVIDVGDITNVPNKYQGTMRYAPLYLKRLREDITRDVAFFKEAGIAHERHAVITHCDTVCEVLHLGTKVRELIEPIVKAMGATQYYTSWGPTRADIKAH